MGLRGILPATIQYKPAKLANLDPPEWLGDFAQAHWRKHALQLAKNNLLNTATVDSFALVCDLWGRFRDCDGLITSRIYLDLVKSYNALAKVFRLVPCDKPGTEPLTRFDSMGTFEDED